MEYSSYEQRVLAELARQIDAADIAAVQRRRHRRRLVIALAGVVVGPVGLVAGLAVSWVYGLIGYAVVVASCLILLLDRPARRLLGGVRRSRGGPGSRVRPLSQ